MGLEQQLREKIRLEGKDKKTADCYWRWIVRFLKFAKLKRGDWVDPREMGRHQVEVFLTHLAVKEQIESMRVVWQQDLARGLNGVSLPYAWGRKSPSSHLDFVWWYLFAAENYSRCPDSGRLLRHHADMGNVGRNITKAAQRAGIPKRITAHCLRHSWVTHSLEGNVPIHVVQALAGHTSMETTAGYAHLTKDGPTATPSPIDALAQVLASPSLTKEVRRTNDEPPQLRVFAG